jgi:hypothetical protein
MFALVGDGPRSSHLCVTRLSAGGFGLPKSRPHDLTAAGEHRRLTAAGVKTMRRKFKAVRGPVSSAKGETTPYDER